MIGAPPYNSASYRNVVRFYEDYLGAVNANQSRLVNAGGGATSISLASTTDRTGLATITLDAVGESGFVGSARLDTWDITSGPIEVESNLMIDVLSDATDTLVVRCGLIDVTSGDSTDGYYVYYTHSANSGKFQGIIRRAGSTVGTLNTITTVAANTWYRILFRVSPINGAMSLWINGYYQGAVTPSSVLTSTHLTGHGINANKSAGTNQQVITTDSISIAQLVDR